jgi:hypothetical protein
MPVSVEYTFCVLNKRLPTLAWQGRNTMTWKVAFNTESHAFAVFTAIPRSRATSVRLSSWPVRAASARRKL